MRTPSKDIKVEGQTKIHVDIAPSGNHTNRHFCGDCGSYVLELADFLLLICCSAIMSVVTEHPEISFLKGGLFVKSGVDLPRPGRQQFWRRAEKWEVPLEGVDLFQ
jgi:hypothetical protein